jgi:glutamate-1-semialdehyde 2,1-aminomutase
VKLDPARFDPLAFGFKGLKGAKDPALVGRIRLGLLNHGVDIMGGPGGLISAMHADRDIDQTAEALRSTIRDLKADGEIRGG